jgi:hypothetical protein
VIGVGVCACGCGGHTQLAKRDDARYGYVKGQPRRHLKGHDKRVLAARWVTARGYVMVLNPRPAPGGQRFIGEHVAVVEQILGRTLPPAAVVHHVDDNRARNVSSNLVVLENQQEHIGLHVRRTVLRAGGNPWTQRLCCGCRRAKDFSEFYPAIDRRFSTECRDCARTRARAWQRQKRGAA